MAQGSKENYTSKQKRQARHIEESEKKSGRSAKRSTQIAWATVNKETGGAGKKVAAKNSNRSLHAKHSAAAKKAWRTRRQDALH